MEMLPSWSGASAAMGTVGAVYVKGALGSPTAVGSTLTMGAVRDRRDVHVDAPLDVLSTKRWNWPVAPPHSSLAREAYRARSCAVGMMGWPSRLRLKANAAPPPREPSRKRTKMTVPAELPPPPGLLSAPSVGPSAGSMSALGGGEGGVGGGGEGLGGGGEGGGWKWTVG